MHNSRHPHPLPIYIVAIRKPGCEAVAKLITTLGIEFHCGRLINNNTPVMWISLVVAMVMVTHALAGCPTGYRYYPGDNSCLKAGSSRQSYDRARQICQSEGADLAQVRDIGKTRFISGFLPVAYWMGLHDPGKNQQWTYVDGTPLGSYAPWNKGEPNNSGGKEFCVLVHGPKSRSVGNWNDGYCPDQLSYVCEMKSCPEGYRYYYGDSSCLKPSDDRKSFDDARKVCKADGGDLVQVKDTLKTRFISGLLPVAYWMGLHDPQHNQQWKYVDGTPLGSYKRWNAGEPNNSGGREFCVLVHGHNSRSVGNWNDGYCPDRLSYVCEMRPCPQGYKRYPGDNSCIKPYQVRKSYNDARKTCHNDGADLVQVRDAGKSKFISGIQPQAYWMGLHDPDHNQKWTYLDGRPLGSYAPWNRGEPNNTGGKEFCVLVHGPNSRSVGNWNDGYCPDQLYFVCEV